MARSLRAVPLVVATLALLALLGPLGAAAQVVELEDEPRSGVLTADQSNDVPPDVQHARGTYAGVKAGGNQLPPVPATPHSTPAIVTFPGFQMRPDGGSRVFVQLTSPVATAVQAQGNVLVIDLGNAQIGGATNRLPLYTRYFNTPVVRAQLVHKDGRTRLELELRTQVNPQLTSENVQSGFHFVYVDFPPGSYLLASPQAAAPAPSSAPGQPLPPPAPPEPAPPQVLDELPKKQGASLDTSMDGELPPGMGPTRASGKGKAKAGLKL